MAGIFKAYDIRGKYPDELDEPMAKKIGAAFSRLLEAGMIVVGRDMRLSSPSLGDAFIEGCVSGGSKVTDIGMTSTSMLYWAIIKGKFNGGAMITASHLPGEMNGIKLCRENAIPLSGDEGLPALERFTADDGDAPRISEPQRTRAGSRVSTDLMPVYLDSLVSHVDNPQQLTMAVDAGNGMAGPEVMRLCSRVPKWNLIPLYFEPDGRFPNHPANPFLPSTTVDLQKCVVRNHADLGIAFDGDADRCSFIDEQGERVPPDIVTALLAEFILSKAPGATILYDLRSSRIVPEIIERLGGTAKRCRVGHAFIKTMMQRENAIFAGELSGHYYHRNGGYYDSGILTMVLMVNLLSKKSKPFSRIVAPLKKYSATGEVNMRVGNVPAIMAALDSAYTAGEKDGLDGLTINYPAWWFNIRSSNTEPVIRLNLEAESQELMGRKREEVLQIIRETDPSMHIEAE
jgi:phosphomannomutase